MRAGGRGGRAGRRRRPGAPGAGEWELGAGRKERMALLVSSRRERRRSQTGEGGDARHDAGVRPMP